MGINICWIPTISWVCSSRLLEPSTLIKRKLQPMACLPLNDEVEEKTMQLCQARKIKLPDAIIVATALVHDLELLSFDEKMLTVMSFVNK